MRPIDADALIEGYKHMGYDPTEHPEESYMEGWCKGFNAAVDHCMHHVIHAPTIEPQLEQRWIPCAERLPEDGGLYLVSNKRDTWVSLYDDGEWRSVSFSILLEGVVAWMPLPEPYKGEP